MITINNITYRNLPEQVEKNKEDIAEIKQNIGPGTGTKVYQHNVYISGNQPGGNDIDATFQFYSTDSSLVSSIAELPDKMTLPLVWGKTLFSLAVYRASIYLDKENDKIYFDAYSDSSVGYIDGEQTLSSLTSNYYTCDDEVYEI
jgi:hypothetical protein